MRKLSCLIASFALLGTAACTADGPLAPQLAPEPARMQRSAETTDAARELVQWLESAGLIQADRRSETIYLVDGVILGGRAPDIDMMDIVAIEVNKRGIGHMEHLNVVITTRAGQMRERS